MTAVRRDSSEETPFGKWIRNHPGLDSIRERLSITDSDYWIHQYRAHRDKVGSRAVDSIMLLEVKTHSRDLPMAQRDTLYLTNQLLRIACQRSNGRRKYIRVRSSRVGETRVVRCFGVHQLILSSSDPANSATILWDGRVITGDMLVETLRFDRDPDDPSKQLTYRRHHTSLRARVMQLFPEIDP